MFRDDAQACRSIGALLKTVRLERMWTAEGPTPEALELLKEDGGPLSSGERVMLLAAFGLWNGTGGLKLSEVIETLDERPAQALCTLIFALKRGAAHVDSWLAMYARDR